MSPTLRNTVPCCCWCVMGLLLHEAQSISLITEAVVHYVSEMTPRTSHNPWVRFPPLCSGTLIFISSCPSSPTSNILSHFFFAHFLLIHHHLPEHLFEGRNRRGKKSSRWGKSLFFLPLLLLTFSPAHCVFCRLCQSQSPRPSLSSFFRISLLKPLFLSLMLHVNLGPASSLVHGGPPKMTKKKKKQEEGGRVRVGVISFPCPTA